MAGTAQAGSHGGMDIREQRGTFSHFLKAIEWGSLLVVASVALLTVAFAMGFGWFAGLGAYVAIGVVAGLLLRMGGAWWAFLIGTTVLMGLGGLVVSLVA